MSTIPFDRRIAEAITEILGANPRVLWGEYLAEIPYRKLVDTLQARGFLVPSIEEAIKRLVRDGDLRWGKIVFHELINDTEQTHELLSVCSTQSLWRWLPGEIESVGRSKDSKIDKVNRLRSKVVEAYIDEALIKCHDYSDREIGNYDSEIKLADIARKIAKERKCDVGNASPAVTSVLKEMFPGDRTMPGVKPGLPTYKAYRKAGVPLLHWFIRRREEGRAFGTIADLRDMDEKKLSRRVGLNS